LGFASSIQSVVNGSISGLLLAGFEALGVVTCVRKNKKG
jgi:hypothetical protein